MSKGFSEYYTTHKEEVDLSKTAVIIVDMMNDFCKPQGKMPLGEDISDVIAAIKRLTDKARENKIPVIWVKQRYRADKYDKVTEKREGTCYEGTWGGEQIEELPTFPEDYVVYKRRFSGFFQTDLDLVLRDMGAEKVVVGGVVTNICVRETVADAFALNYYVYIPVDCTRATDDRAQAAHMWDFETHYATLTDVDELVEAMGNLKEEGLCRMK